jgi:hypothetical protein
MFEPFGSANLAVMNRSVLKGLFKAQLRFLSSRAAEWALEIEEIEKEMMSYELGKW